MLFVYLVFEKYPNMMTFIKDYDTLYNLLFLFCNAGFL